MELQRVHTATVHVEKCHWAGITSSAACPLVDPFWFHLLQSMNDCVEIELKCASHVEASATDVQQGKPYLAHHCRQVLAHLPARSRTPTDWPSSMICKAEEMAGNPVHCACESCINAMLKAIPGRR